MINSGNTNITKVYYSGFTISKIYACGGELVWSGDTPTPPTPTDNKLKYVVSGSEYTIVCNGDSTLEPDEVRFDLIRRGLKASAVTDVEIGTCVNTLAIDAFNRYTSLSSVTIPNSVTTIDANVFYECYSLSSITIPNTVASIGYQTFKVCKNLKSIIIPNGITTISEELCDDCCRLTSVTIPSSVTLIENSAFEIEESDNPQDDAAARSTLVNRQVYIYATVPPTIGVNVFESNIIGVSATYPIYVPNGSVEAYKTAWPQYALRIQAIQ